MSDDGCRNFDMASLIHAMVGRPLEQLFVREYTLAGEVVLEVRNLTRRGEFANIDFTLRAGEKRKKPPSAVTTQDVQSGGTR